MQKADILAGLFALFITEQGNLLSRVKAIFPPAITIHERVDEMFLWTMPALIVKS